MTDFTSTGNFRDVLSLARRAVVALERIATALESSTDPETLDDQDRARRDAVRLGQLRHARGCPAIPTLEDSVDGIGGKCTCVQPSTPSPFCRECGRPLTSEPGDYCTDHVNPVADSPVDQSDADYLGRHGL